MKLVVTTIIVLYFMLMVSANCAEPEALLTDLFSTQEKDRPFETPDDLRSHLNNLSHFYAIVGRPRFGKRSATSDRDSAYNYLKNYLLQRYRHRLSIPNNLEDYENIY